MTNRLKIVPLAAAIAAAVAIVVVLESRKPDQIVPANPNVSVSPQIAELVEATRETEVAVRESAAAMERAAAVIATEPALPEAPGTLPCWRWVDFSPPLAVTVEPFKSQFTHLTVTTDEADWGTVPYVVQPDGRWRVGGPASCSEPAEMQATITFYPETACTRVNSPSGCKVGSGRTLLSVAIVHRKVEVVR